MKNECLLYSSGIDSYLAKIYLEDHGHQFDCLYFDHGGRYCQQEIEKIKSLNFKVQISTNLQLGDLEEDDAFIPNRNLLMVTMAQSFGYSKIWLGGSLSDRVGDNKSEVCSNLSRILTSVNEKYCKIDSPFYNCYKDDMVRWYVENYPFNRINLINDTFSCYDPLDEEIERPVWIQGTRSTYSTKECMKCSACFRKCAVLFSGDIFIQFNESAPFTIISNYNNQFRRVLVKTSRSIGTIKYIEKLQEMMING